MLAAITFTSALAFAREGASVFVCDINDEGAAETVEMIQKNYAVHIADVLDAAAINTKRPRRRNPTTQPAAT